MSNWDKLDYFLPMALVKEENALTDLVGGKKATNNGATKVLQGFQFSGAEWIQANYNPGTDGKGWQLNDALVGVFAFDATNTPTSEGLYGMTPATHTRLYGNSDANTYATINGGGFNSLPNTSFTDKTNYIVHRNATQVFIEVDGIQDAGNSTPVAVSDGINGMFIGAVTENNGNPKQFMNGILSTFSAGAGAGVDQVAKNDHIRQFLTELGLDLTPDLNKLAGATNTDTLEGDTDTDELIGEA